MTREPIQFFALFWACCVVVLRAQGDKLQCSLPKDYGEDPSLQEMTYDIGNGEQTFMAHVEPSVEAMYNGNPPASTLVSPLFRGFSTKFINMSTQKVKLFWVPDDKTRPPSPMNVILPFHEAGTASFPGHNFILAHPDDTQIVYHRCLIGEYPHHSLQVYDPYENDPEGLAQLSADEQRQYKELKDTLNFSSHYKAFTGRPYLANYLRDRPKHFIWPANYFGQQHWVESRETHFTAMPQDEHVKPIEPTALEGRMLDEYRAPGTLNMTLKVLSVAPRAFEILNFLSQTEIDHILKIAAGITLSRSTVGNVEKDMGGETDAEKKMKEQVKSDTRTSLNSWVERGRSPIVDAVYRRAADLMRIDEALFRDREEHEAPEFETKRKLVEHLQLVHYDPGQQYTAHHDFGYRDLKRNQRARFGTILFYLNHEGLEGGETTFPRWKNAETFHSLKVKPEAGKAVLFYSQLPDGNFDDFSQHSAEKPRAGEKWLINLWSWSPLMDD